MGSKRQSTDRKPLSSAQAEGTLGGGEQSVSNQSQIDAMGGGDDASGPSPFLDEAKVQAREANKSLNTFKWRRADTSKKGNRGLLNAAVDTVHHRNKEFQNVVGHAGSRSVETEKDKGVLWSGDKMHFGRDAEGNETREAEYSAMLSAQKYARKIHGKTVEMTAAGDEIEGHSSFGGLMDRFGYLYNNPEVKETSTMNGLDVARKQRDMKKRKQETISGIMKKGLGENVNQLSPESRANLGSKGSGAGEIWDVISERYAAGLSGDVTAIHAMNKDEYLDENNEARHPFDKSTYMRKERPKLSGRIGQDVTRVIDKFNDQDLITSGDGTSTQPNADVADYLRGPDEKTKQKGQTQYLDPEVDKHTGLPVSGS